MILIYWKKFIHNIKLFQYISKLFYHIFKKYHHISKIFHHLFKEFHHIFKQYNHIFKQFPYIFKSYQHIIYKIIFNQEETALHIACKKDYYLVVKILLSSNKININVKDNVLFQLMLKLFYPMIWLFHHGKPHLIYVQAKKQRIFFYNKITLVA